MTGVSKNCWVTLAGRNIDHYPLLIKTILKPQGVRFSSDNSLAGGGTPSTSVPRQQISIRIVQKSFNKKPLLHFSVSFILLVPQVLTGLVAGSGVVSGHLAPVLFTWFLWRRHFETLWQFAKWSHVHQTHTGPGTCSAPCAPHPLLCGQTRGTDIHYYHHTVLNIWPKQEKVGFCVPPICLIANVDGGKLVYISRSI